MTRHPSMGDRSLMRCMAILTWLAFPVLALEPAMPSCHGFDVNFDASGYYEDNLDFFDYPDAPTTESRLTYLEFGATAADQVEGTTTHMWGAIKPPYTGDFSVRTMNVDSLQVWMFDAGLGFDGEKPSEANGATLIIDNSGLSERKKLRSADIPVVQGEPRVMHIFYGKKAKRARLVRIRWGMTSTASMTRPSYSLDWSELFCAPKRGKCSQTPVLPFPQDPSEDPTIQNPRHGEQRVVTRSTNSELVDLRHPGKPYQANGQLVGCPYEEEGLIHWEDIVSADAGKDVVLPENTKVLLSSCSKLSDFVLGTITVPASSELIFADEPIALAVEGIQVLGAMRAGSETCPLMSEISITLHGARPPTNRESQAMHYKGIDVNGGVLEIHGVEYYQTWSRLAVTAKSGESLLLIQDVVNWEVGARILVTSTALKDARDWHQNDEAVVEKVSRVSHLGEQVTAIKLRSALKYDHYGGAEYQAEVGLLSRRFLIQGDSASEPIDTLPLGCADRQYASYPCANHLTGYGGHVIIRQGGIGKVEGVELFRMGQTNFEGRYPMHFHLLGDHGSNSYIRSSSIHRSFFKCVTIHASNSVLAARNVAFDIIGHCLYLEDGVELNNVVEFNLHAHIHPIGKPPGAGSTKQFLSNVYDSEDLTTASDSTASGFYISNSNNFIRGNAAVGGFSGFHFPIFPEPIGKSRDSPITPRGSTTAEFDGNSCHSSGYWWGHAGCLYAGGLFEHMDPVKHSPMRYNPGRTINGLRPCQIPLDSKGRCPEFEQPQCTGSYPTACTAYLNFTNFKASLTRIGGMNWGQRTKFYKTEVHDFYGGPMYELFGDNSVDNFLATCRTENFPDAPKHCGNTMAPHEGDQTPRTCRPIDQTAWNAPTRVVTWYDTAMNTAITDGTIRSCDPSTWPRCRGKCRDKSTIFQLLAHSDQFLPEFMSITAGIRYENDANVLDHLAEFNKRNPRGTISGRFGGWLDDGSSCLRPEWDAAIIGSNQDAGEWWRIDDECFNVAPGDLMWCCPANGRTLASVVMKWDDRLDRQLAGNGGKRCDNTFGNKEGCTHVGYLAKFGDTNLEVQGVKLHQRAEFTGIIPGFGSSYTGPVGGWYVWLSSGPPVKMEFDRIQAHHQGLLVIAVTYPKGTTFNVEMKADGNCNSRKYVCSKTFERAYNHHAMTKPWGSYKYYIDTSSPTSVTLYIRLTQRPSRGLNDNSKPWQNNVKAPLYTNNYLENMTDSRDWGIPYRFNRPVITVKANCRSTDGVYCDGGPQPKRIPGFLPTF